MNEQEYTVFCTRHDDDADGLVTLEAANLEELVREFVDTFGHGLRPTLWVAGNIQMMNRTADSLRAESLQAGRLIEKTASGWVALGAEKQEEKAAQTLADPRDAQESLGEEFEKVLRDNLWELYGPADAAMIARDGPQQDSYCVCRNHTAPGIVHRSDGPCYVMESTASAAKANPFPNTLRSPDCDSGPSDHLNASRHQMAGMSKS